MIATLVHIWVKPSYIDAFKEASIKNHLASIKEPGNLRFDVLQDDEDTAKFVLYEAYESEAAAAVHKDATHYKGWRETVAEWMAQPRKGKKHEILAPSGLRA